MSKEYKIKFHKKGLNLKDGTDKYEVRTKGGEGQTVKFDDKAKDGGTAEGQVELEFKKESESNWTTWTVEKENVKYAETTFFKGVKITKKQMGTLELKEELPQVGVGFFASKRWPFWTIAGGIVVGLLLLIWWWIASRRKEDKEEESL
ncbi:protein of unknown function [endosymbiont DhMRE of Dentiscutata heterogama]|uniref:hypothetical protein n=1 Tax=endosymbiont DhMRE of Dentiscutata heterogama TaxID=1609546 RepID=UPI000629DB9C|nr:hypothetical protein [endosymbiont DhMRE of Dentiscutata heterogama]CFW93454.1 protein of unknown function [endosymbiont DhMRE of Dentiscutata heterogama]